MENKKIKILLIEDSVDDAELIRRKLEKSASARFKVTIAQKLNDGLEQLVKNPPDLILSDLGLPDSHGLDTVTKILLEVPHIPLVVLSGFDDEAIAMKAVKSGAQDYLVKGQLESSQLERSLYYSIERARLQEELEQHTQEIFNIQANLHKILEKNADAIVVVGKDKRVLFINPAGESLLGRKQKELLNRPFDNKLVTGKPSEIIITRPDGEKYTVEMSVVDIDWEGKPASLISMHDITKRKQMENALRDSEEKFSAAFRASPDIIAIGNLKKAIYVEVNDSYTRATGYSREEIVGHPMEDINMWVNPSDSQKMMRLFDAQGKITNEEFTFRMKSGEICQWLCSAEMVNIGGEPCIMSVATDITERKQMEKVIRESEEKFSKAFHSSANLFAICNLENGNFMEVNDSFLHMTAYTREELIGHNATELNLWDSEEERERIPKKTREFKTVRNEQIKIRSKFGEIRTGLFSSEQITIGGEPCFINTIADITELKRAEESVRVSEEKFSKAFLRSPEVIIISNIDDGTICEANDTFIRVTGYTREEVIGKKTSQLGIWAIPEERAQTVKTLKEKGTVTNRECQFRMKSGELRTWLFSAEIITIDNQPRMLSVTTDITDRKKAEEELRFSDTALKSIHEGVFALDNEFKITRWNEMCEQMFGVKASDVIGKSATDVITMVEQYPGQNIERINLLLEKGFNREEQIYRTPRGDVWVDVQAQAMEENGKRYGWITLVSDIAERKKTEQALKQSEEKFRELINTSNDGIVSIDTQMQFILWNHGAERLLGYTEKEMLGKSVLIIFPEPDQKKVAREIFTLKNTGTSTTINRVFETNILKKDCSLVPVDISISARKTEGGYISTAIMRDITVRKEAEEKLRQSEERYRDLFENANDLIQSCNIEGKFVYVNRAWREALGYSEKEVLNLNFWDVIKPEHLAQCQQTFQKILSGETVTNIETAFVTKDGKLIQVEGNVNPVRQDEKVVATRAFFHDISVRKEAEEKLRKIDQMKSEFLSNVSHELRTPLQSISGFTKLIMNGQVPDPTTQQEFLQIIDRETMHLGNLINGLLDMSRLEAGRFKIYKKLIPITDIFIDPIKMFHSLAREKNITLSEDISREIPEMEIDSERMRQVLINLIGNAIKFSDPGSSVRIKLEKRPEDLLFQVSDNGIGIREESMKHLFERFYRSEGETVRGGTGLGLYISKQIIEAHGGRIWAESKFGEGSTFSFTLPLNGKGGNGNGKENSNN